MRSSSCTASATLLLLCCVVACSSTGVPGDPGHARGGANLAFAAPLSPFGSATLRRSAKDVLASPARPVKLAASASFQEAQGVGMKLGMQMVAQLEQAEQVEGSAQEVLNALLSHSDGARGWWVTSLTVEEMEPLFASDKTITAMADAVLASPDPNRRLLAMNVAMSTATAEYWKAEGQTANAEGSLTTKRRTTILLRKLLSSLSGLKEALAELRAAASGEVKEGEWVAFLDRWGYGASQRTAIVAAIDSV